MQDVLPHRRSDEAFYTSLLVHSAAAKFMRKKSQNRQIVSSQDMLIVWPTAQLVRGCISFRSWVINHLCGSQTATASEAKHNESL